MVSKECRGKNHPSAHHSQEKNKDFWCAKTHQLVVPHPCRQMYGIDPFLATQPMGPKSQTAALRLVDTGKTMLLEEAFHPSILSAEDGSGKGDRSWNVTCQSIVDFMVSSHSHGKWPSDCCFTVHVLKVVILKSYVSVNFEACTSIGEVLEHQDCRLSFAQINPKTSDPCNTQNWTNQCWFRKKRLGVLSVEHRLNTARPCFGFLDHPRSSATKRPGARSVHVARWACCRSSSSRRHHAAWLLLVGWSKLWHSNETNIDQKGK